VRTLWGFRWVVWRRNKVDNVSVQIQLEKIRALRESERELTFRECHDKLVNASLPWRLSQWRQTVKRPYQPHYGFLRLLRVEEDSRQPCPESRRPTSSGPSSHPRFLPDERRNPRARECSRSVLPSAGTFDKSLEGGRRRTKGWSFRHCFRSSASRVRQIPA
jgi:hypothetical protein